MVVIGLDRRCDGRPRMHGESVGILDGVDTEPSQFGHDGGESVGLLVADESDPGHRRRTLGEDRHRRHRLGRVGDLPEIGADSPQDTATYGDRLSFDADLGAHLGEDIDEPHVSLQGVDTESGNRHRSPTDGRSREEVRRRRRIRFDLVVLRAVTAGLDDEDVGVGSADRCPERTHHGDSHVEVRTGDDRTRRREQQPGDELTRDRGGDSHRRHRSGCRNRSVDLHRESTRQLDLRDRDTQRSQRIEGITHGSAPHRFVGIETCGVRREGQDRRDETGRRARLPGIEGTGWHERPAHPGDRQGRQVVLDDDSGSERTSTPDHRLGVIGQECSPQTGGPGSQGRRQQCPVGDALRARRFDDGIDGTSERHHLPDLDHQRSSPPSSDRSAAR